MSFFLLAKNADNNMEATMNEWEPYAPTAFRILGDTMEIGERVKGVRKLWRHGISPKYEWNYYYDCFMWIINHVGSNEEFKQYYGYTDLGDAFGISNGSAFLKIKGRFNNNYCVASDDINFTVKRESPFEELWRTIEERCTDENRQGITDCDGAKIRGLMALPWGWHIQFIFECLGYDLEPKEEYSPFMPGKKLPVASPRESAEYFGIEFFTEQRHKMLTTEISQSRFSILEIWLALKIMKASKATERTFGVYVHNFKDGRSQSYLRITADSNESYLCGSKL